MEIGLFRPSNAQFGRFGWAGPDSTRFIIELETVRFLIYICIYIVFSREKKRKGTISKGRKFIRIFYMLFFLTCEKKLKVWYRSDNNYIHVYMYIPPGRVCTHHTPVAESFCFFRLERRRKFRFYFSSPFESLFYVSPLLSRCPILQYLRRFFALSWKSYRVFYNYYYFVEKTKISFFIVLSPLSIYI